MTFALLFATVAMGSAAQSYTIDDIVQKNFQDASFVAKVDKGDQSELKKINNDFAMSYRFTSVHAKVKEPNMIRLDSKVEDTNVLYILNGTRKLYNVGNKIKHVEDVSRAPGKRQTPLDFGVLTPSLFKDLFVAKFVRVDRETGDLVFDLTYEHPRYDDTSRHRIWVDKERRYVKKRAWFGQDGHQLATFIYDNPMKMNGVTFPTKCTVKNVDEKVAGITEYDAIKINTGLSDSIFKF